MNEDDSEQIASLLIQMGMSPTSDEQEADVAILVTCSVREKPENKARSKLGELREIKENKPDMIIGVCGCMAQREGDKLRRNRPYLDFVVGTHCIHEIPDLINGISASHTFKSSLELPVNAGGERPLPSRVERENVGLQCFVPIMYGCDNFCSYCVVPYVRGRERSRTPDDILTEIQSLTGRGCREVVLLGQNVNSYSSSGIDFADLLKMVDQIDSIKRIRFTTSHPKDLSNKLIDAMASIPKVCEHIHLAMQSGNDRILSRMNRKYTAEHFKERVKSLREAVPGIAVTTDLITGFPGETEDEFSDTLRIVEELRFDSAYMFAFNPIPRTAAAGMEEQLEHSIKNERLNRLIKLQNAITCEINNSQVGNIYQVLVEGWSPRDKNKITGHTRQNKIVNIDCSRDLTGELIDIKITEGHLHGFSGVLIQTEE